jgi:hypothetical protein
VPQSGCNVVSLPRNQSESRMREIRTSGLMSGEGKRTAHAAPRISSTLPSVVHLPSCLPVVGSGSPDCPELADPVA